MSTLINEKGNALHSMQAALTLNEGLPGWCFILAVIKQDTYTYATRAPLVVHAMLPFCQPVSTAIHYTGETAQETRHDVLLTHTSNYV